MQSVEELFEELAMSLKYQQPYKIDLWERMIIPLYSSVDSPPLPAPVGNWNRAQFKMLIKSSFISSFTVVNAIFCLPSTEYTSVLVYVCFWRQL